MTLRPPHLDRFLSNFSVPSDPAKYNPVKRRAPMEALAARLGTAEDVRAVGEEIAGWHCEWVSAAGSQDDRALVWLHGGGFSAGSCATHRAMAGELARETGARVLTIDYPHSPEAQFPAALEAGIAVFGAVASRAHIAKLALGGDSAGGALALGIALAARDAGMRMAAALLLFSPWLDLTCTAASHTTHASIDPMVDPAVLRIMAGDYLGTRPPDDHRASPLFTDLSRLPPMLLQAGSNEVLLDDTLALDRKARAAGVQVSLEIWPEMVHVFQTYGQFLPEAGAALERAGRFCRSQWITE